MVSVYYAERDQQVFMGMNGINGEEIRAAGCTIQVHRWYIGVVLSFIVQTVDNENVRFNISSVTVQFF